MFRLNFTHEKNNSFIAKLIRSPRTIGRIINTYTKPDKRLLHIIMIISIILSSLCQNACQMQRMCIIYFLFLLEAKSERRDKLQKYLEGNGVGTVIHYPIAPHKQECYANEAWNIPQLILPITEHLADCEHCQ